MKRIAILGLMCICFLLGITFSRAIKPANAEGNKTTKWMKAAEGVYFQQLWNDDEWPQVIVLKFSNHAYEEFRTSPAKFINSYPKKFFPVSVNEPSPAAVTLMAPQEPDGYWYVIVSHGRPSTSYYAAIPEPPEKLEQSPKP
jgi:hypothetical protein